MSILVKIYIETLSEDCFTLPLLLTSNNPNLKLNYLNFALNFPLPLP